MRQVIYYRYFRPAEVETLLDDATKARSVLNWSPRVDFLELVRMMVDADIGETRQRLEGRRAPEAQAIRWVT